MRSARGLYDQLPVVPVVRRATNAPDYGFLVEELATIARLLRQQTGFLRRDAAELLADREVFEQRFDRLEALTCAVDLVVEGLRMQVLDFDLEVAGAAGQDGDESEFELEDGMRAALDRAKQFIDGEFEQGHAAFGALGVIDQAAESAGAAADGVVAQEQGDGCFELGYAPSQLGEVVGGLHGGEGSTA